MGRQPKVRMPEPDYRNRTAQNHRNGYLVPTYGSATVQAAEMAVVLDVMIMAGIVRPTEMMDMIEKKCIQIDAARRQSAGFDK